MQLSERILQYLASEGMVEEVGEDQFAATRISRVLSLPGFKAGLNHQSVSPFVVTRYLLILSGPAGWIHLCPVGKSYQSF